MVTLPPAARCRVIPEKGKREAGGKPPLSETMPGTPANWPARVLHGEVQGRAGRGW